MNEASPAARHAVIECAAGRLSPHVTLMTLLWEFRSAEATRAFLTARRHEHSGPLETVLSLLDENREGCERIAAMVRSGVDTDAPAASVEEGIAFCKRLFDWSVQQSEEASVALYSLGNAQILDAATREIVTLFEREGLLGLDRCVLQIGCGIGRIEQAIAGRVREAVGIDVSENMIAAAQRRCAGLANVSLRTCSGRDLELFESGRFDLVYAVDSFPYLVQSGMDLVETHFAEAQRVLRPRGEFLVLNFSYRGDDALDRRDVQRLAQAHGFDVVLDGTRPFSLWDGVVFQLRRNN